MSDMFQSILDTHPDIICRFDEDLKFIYANQAASVLFRFDRSALIGKPLIDHVPESQKVEVYDRLRGLSVNNPTITTLHKVTREHGILYILWTNIAVIKDGVLTGYQSVGRDVSPETRRRHEIRDQA